MATETDNDAARVLTLLRQTWDKAANMAASDGVPESDRGKLAAPVLTAFLDGVRDKIDNPALADQCARAYLAALIDYRNGGR